MGKKNIILTRVSFPGAMVTSNFHSVTGFVVENTLFPLGLLISCPNYNG